MKDERYKEVRVVCNFERFSICIGYEHFGYGKLGATRAGLSFLSSVDCGIGFYGYH